MLACTAFKICFDMSTSKSNGVVYGSKKPTFSAEVLILKAQMLLKIYLSAY